MYDILIHKALFVFIVLSFSFIGDYIVGRLLKLYKDKIAKRTKTKHDDELVPLVKRLVGMFIWLAGIVLILVEFGVNVTGLYATLGAGGIATGLLVKDSVANIVAGVTLMFDRPFRVGDEVKLKGGDIGKIIKIGLRRTNVLLPRSKDHEKGKCVLVIPNSHLSKAKVYNYTLAKELDDEKETT